MPLDNKKIDALRLKVNFKQKKNGKSFETDSNGKLIERSREEKLKEISALDPLQTIPVILDILDKVVSVLAKNNDANLDPTKKFLAYAKTYLTDVDTKLNAGPFEKIGILKDIVKNPQQFTNDLKKFEDEIKSIQVTEPALSLWMDAELWIEGWYRHTADMYIAKHKSLNNKRPHPKDPSKQVYKTIDLEDDGFFLATNNATNPGTCKMEVAEVNHRVAQTIQQLIGVYKSKQEELLQQAQKQAKQEVVIPEQPKLIEKTKDGVGMLTNQKVEEKTKETETATVVNFHDMVQLNKVNGKASITINLPENSETLEKNLLAAIQGVLSPDYQEIEKVELNKEELNKEEYTEETWPNILNELKEINRDVKLIIYRSYVVDENIPPLTPGQLKMLKDFKKDVVEALEGYNDRWYTFQIPYFGYEISIPKARPAYHGKTASDLIETINAPNEDATQKSPMQIIKILFEAMPDLRKDQSKTLQPIIETQILNVFDTLRMYKPNKQSISSRRESQGLMMFKSAPPPTPVLPHLSKTPSQSSMLPNQK